MNPIPPEVIMGEAGICSFWAMIAIAYVYQRNPRMYGWNDQPNDKAIWAARLWPLLPDPTNGARYVFSFSDLRRKQVKGIIRETGPPKWISRCKVGGLVFY